MREILFRAKLLFNEKIWVYGSFVEEDYDEYPQIISNGDGGMYEVICETLGQYIGLLDKNGKKIFEGDICKVTLFTCEGEDKHYLCEVCFDCGSFVFRERSGFYILFVDIYDFETDVEVIGNIYDNPELIGEKTND